jgi:methyl coenzyme M reductase subunit C-like uncharacterized protein (methanogenesis marker protein 7)
LQTARRSACQKTADMNVLLPSMLPLKPSLLMEAKIPCRIIDLSVSGAAVEMDARPNLGAMITVGNMTGRVVRRFHDGVAIEFLSAQSSETIGHLSWRNKIDDARVAR